MQDALEAKDLLLGKNKVEMKYTNDYIRFYMRSISYWKDRRFFKQLKNFIFKDGPFKIFYLNLSKDCNFVVLELQFRFASDRIDAIHKWEEYNKIAL